MFDIPVGGVTTILKSAWREDCDKGIQPEKRGEGETNWFM